MKKLYLDMDGVVADFNAYAEKICGFKVSDDRWPEDAWLKIKENPRIYAELEKTPEADELVNFCKIFANNYNYDLMFLTAIPRSNDVAWAFQDKFDWAKRHYNDIPIMFGPYSKDKHLHCRSGDILIDDRTSNIIEWRNAGGIAVLHKGNLDVTITELTNIVIQKQ